MPRSTRDEGPTKRSLSSPIAGRSAILIHSLLSFVSFLCALCLVCLLLWNAELLARFELTGIFNYFILLVLGLSVAAFLFGSLRSFARYHGKHFNGVLELGGPVVAFLLTVLFGFLLPPRASNFPLTVYVHGYSGPQDLLLRNHGFVLVQLGSEVRSAPIGDKGQAYFTEIPANFHGQAVNVVLDADGYEIAEPATKHLNSTSISLVVRRQPWNLAGAIQDEAGNPVPNATVTAAGLSAISTPAGRFEIVIPPNRVQPLLTIQVVAKGYSPWHGPVVPRSNETTVVLTPLR